MDSAEWVKRWLSWDFLIICRNFDIESIFPSSSNVDILSGTTVTENEIVLLRSYALWVHTNERLFAMYFVIRSAHCFCIRLDVIEIVMTWSFEKIYYHDNRLTNVKVMKCCHTDIKYGLSNTKIFITACDTISYTP